MKKNPHDDLYHEFFLMETLLNQWKNEELSLEERLERITNYIKQSVDYYSRRKKNG